MQAAAWTSSLPPAPDARAAELGRLAGLEVRPGAVHRLGSGLACLGRSDAGRRLAFFGDSPPAGPTWSRSRVNLGRDRVPLAITAADHPAAAALRAGLPRCRPRPLGVAMSAGLGDRLGLAGPGHLRGLRSFAVSPVLAQQSVRELARTGREPEDVLDAATFAVFEDGYDAPWGADADHLKTPEDIGRFSAAGFTFFTLDPSAKVDERADALPLDALEARAADLDWAGLDSSLSDCERRYLKRAFRLGSTDLRFERPALLRAVVKYGDAVALTAALYRHLLACSNGSPVDVEVSVDETDSPTDPLEHLLVAEELVRLGVRFVSLAPRFIGRFEKGVDYLGAPAEFEAAFSLHAAIAEQRGPYKLSLHSGSDKFAIYPAVARQAHKRFHLKTAGTWYLEALRVFARHSPDGFRALLALARERYPEERASYHVSAGLDRVPGPHELTDAELPGLLDDFDARQVLHVTFGACLDAQRDALLCVLTDNEEDYAAAVAAHLRRHLEPLCA